MVISEIAEILNKNESRSNQANKVIGYELEIEEALKEDKAFSLETKCKEIIK